MTKRIKSKAAASRGGHNLHYRDDAAHVRRAALENLEELLGIYADTDPKLGPASEKNKYWAALWAIQVAGNLTYRLTNWAENHIVGVIYRRARTQDQSAFDWNSHANEHQNYVDDNGLMLTDEQYREYIATVLEKSRHSRNDWRQQLATALVALNYGEVQFLSKPSRTSKHGRPFTLRNLRWMAVLHVHVLFGTGLKKFVAESKIADALAQSVETLRAWEKQFLKSNKELRYTLQVAQKVARHGLHDFENLSREKAWPEFSSDEESHSFISEWCEAKVIHSELRKHPLRRLALELKGLQGAPLTRR